MNSNEPALTAEPAELGASRSCFRAFFHFLIAEWSERAQLRPPTVESAQRLGLIDVEDEDDGIRSKEKRRRSDKKRSCGAWATSRPTRRVSLSRVFPSRHHASCLSQYCCERLLGLSSHPLSPPNSVSVPLTDYCYPHTLTVFPPLFFTSSGSQLVPLVPCSETAANTNGHVTLGGHRYERFSKMSLWCEGIGRV